MVFRKYIRAGTYIHAHLANIFRYPVHQIAGIVSFVKRQGEFLVMRKQFVLLIVFDMPAHDDKRLPHEEQKESVASASAR